MSAKSSATVKRTTATGQFSVRKESGSTSLHASGKETPKTVNTSINKNRDALQRLANR